MTKKITKLTSILENDYDPALFEAIDQNIPIDLRKLQTAQVNLNAVDENNVSPLNLAAYNGNASMVAYICWQNHPRKIVIRDDLGNNPLHSVFGTNLFGYSKKSDYREVTDIVHTLLTLKIDPNEKNLADKSAFDLLRENNEIKPETKARVRGILDTYLVKNASSSHQVEEDHHEKLPSIFTPSSTVGKPPKAAGAKKVALPAIFKNGEHH